MLLHPGVDLGQVLVLFPLEVFLTAQGNVSETVMGKICGKVCLEKFKATQFVDHAELDDHVVHAVRRSVFDLDHTRNFCVTKIIQEVIVTSL